MPSALFSLVFASSLEAWGYLPLVFFRRPPERTLKPIVVFGLLVESPNKFGRVGLELDDPPPEALARLLERPPEAFAGHDEELLHHDCGADSAPDDEKNDELHHQKSHPDCLSDAGQILFHWQPPPEGKEQELRKIILIYNIF